MVPLTSTPKTVVMGKVPSHKLRVLSEGAKARGVCLMWGHRRRVELAEGMFVLRAL